MCAIEHFLIRKEKKPKTLVVSVQSNVYLKNPDVSPGNDVKYDRGVKKAKGVGPRNLKTIHPERKTWSKTFYKFLSAFASSASKANVKGYRCCGAVMFTPASSFETVAYNAVFKDIKNSIPRMSPTYMKSSHKSTMVLTEYNNYLPKLRKPWNKYKISFSD